MELYMSIYTHVCTHTYVFSLFSFLLSQLFIYFKKFYKNLYEYVYLDSKILNNFLFKFPFIQWIYCLYNIILIMTQQYVDFF